MDIIAALMIAVAVMIAVTGYAVALTAGDDRERANLFAALLWVAVLALGGAGWTILGIRHGG